MRRFLQRQLLPARVALLVFVSSAAAGPMMAQDSAGSAPAQHSASAGADGLYRIGDVSAPVLIHEVKAVYPEGARRNKIGGNVKVNLIVDANGDPSHVRVIRGVAADLDASAVEAVKKYKFKPAMTKNGKPVPVQVNLEVSFKIF